MSADNWAICPKCLSNHEEAVSKRQKDVEAAYGKVSSQEYLKLLKDAEDKKKPKNLDTLREDFGIGITEKGEFFVSYRGGCDRCGLEFSYSHEEEIDLEF